LTTAPVDVFFVAGEASGDLQAALAVRAMRAMRPELHAAGCGGDRLRSAGAHVVYDTSELASIGPISIIPRIPLLYGILRWLDATLRKRPPRVLVPVDAGAFNLRLIARMRGAGYRGPIVYYFPPGAWLDDERQARAVAASAMALTPFERQRDFYRRLGLPVAYFGHPLVSAIAPRPPRPLRAAPLIAVLPGSRREETARHLPVLASAAAGIERDTSAAFVAVAASAKRADQIRALWARCGGPPGLTITREDASAALRGADLAWVASGTAVLEAALVGVPQVMFYVVSIAQYRIAQRRLPAQLLRSIALPNLVMQRRIVPELLQEDFTPARLTEETMRLLDHDVERERMQEGYGELRAALGPPDALERNAAFILDQMQEAGVS